MGNTRWGAQKNLENSLIDFLKEKLEESDAISIFNEEGDEIDLDIRAGFEFNNEARLPLVTVYADSKNSERISIGSNLRAKTYLLAIDIRATDPGMQQDITDWVEEVINDGFPFYKYSPSGNPLNPTKVQDGYTSVEFISNRPLRSGDNVESFEKFRQTIVIDVFIN